MFDDYNYPCESKCESKNDSRLSICPACVDMGEVDGCPKCGMYPPEKPEVIDGVEYRFVTNTTSGSKIHEGYKTLKENEKARVLFRDAIDCHRRPIADYIAIWLATEDRGIAKNAGFFILGTT